MHDESARTNATLISTPPKTAEKCSHRAAAVGSRFRFSVAELIVAMTVAAVSFGLLHSLGSTSGTATVLGFVALAGLLAHVLGVNPPNAMVLSWWFILVLYVALSLVAAIFPGIA